MNNVRDIALKMLESGYLPEYDNESFNEEVEKILESISPIDVAAEMEDIIWGMELESTNDWLNRYWR